MDFEEFKAFAEGLPDGKGSELIDFHLGVVDKTKQDFISKLNNRNQENQKLRRFENAVTTLGWNGEDDLNDFVSNLKQTKETVVSKDTTLNELQIQLKKLQNDFQKTSNELNTEREAANGLKAKAKKEKLVNVLKSALEKNNAYGPDIWARDIVSSGTVDLDEQENVVFIKGEDKIPFEDGIKTVIESRPDLIKNGQKPCGGSKPGSPNNGGNTDEDRLTRLRKLAGGGILA